METGFVNSSAVANVFHNSIDPFVEGKSFASIDSVEKSSRQSIFLVENLKVPHFSSGRHSYRKFRLRQGELVLHLKKYQGMMLKTESLLLDYWEGSPIFLAGTSSGQGST